MEEMDAPAPTSMRSKAGPAARVTCPAIVSGEVIMENGEFTGAVPGKLIRGSQAAPEAA